jgi:adenine-specific DNA glycosylase
MSNQTMAKQLQAFYLDWVNNYLTVEKMAEHNELTVEDTANYLLSWAGHTMRRA